MDGFIADRDEEVALDLIETGTFGSRVTHERHRRARGRDRAEALEAAGLRG